MFESLRKKGSFRIDYLNPTARGIPEAFAFYVRGEIEEGAAYSISAKHHLCAGLNFIRKNLNCDNLVAIYVDVNSIDNLFRPAYMQMKRDLRAGLFRRVFTFHSSDLLGDWAAVDDLTKLSRDVPELDVYSFQDGRVHPHKIS
jgi:hypothetical protein